MNCVISPPLWGNLSPSLAARSPSAFLCFAVVVSDLLALLIPSTENSHFSQHLGHLPQG